MYIQRDFIHSEFREHIVEKYKNLLQKYPYIARRLQNEIEEDFKWKPNLVSKSAMCEYNFSFPN